MNPMNLNQSKLIEELALYIINDYECYTNFTSSAIQQIAVGADAYSAWESVIDFGIEKYNKLFYDNEDKLKIKVAAKRKLAEMLNEYYEDEIWETVI